MDHKKLRDVMEQSLNATRYRTLNIDGERASGDKKESNRRSFTVSSEVPDLRLIFTDDGNMVIANEVLRHSEGAVDLTRFRSGANILLDHSPDRVVGVIESAGITDERQLGVDMRFSRNQSGQETKLDVDDGIRQNVSIGYRVASYELRDDITNDNGYPTYEATDWTPAEVSFVGVPADASVGPGRELRSIVKRDLGLFKMEDEKFDILYSEVIDLLASKSDKTDEQVVIVEEVLTKADSDEAAIDTSDQEIRMSENQNTPAEVTVTDKNAERNAIAEIYRMANQYGVDIEKANEAVQRGNTPEQFAIEVLRMKEERADKIDVSDLEMNDKEVRSYDFGRGLRAVLRGETTLETEVSDEIASRRGTSTRGLFMPTHIRALNANLGSTTGDGAEIVFEQAGSFIDLLRAKTVLDQMGTEFLSGLTRKTAFPRQTAGVAGTWIDEDPASGVTAATMSLDQLQIEPKTLAAQSPYSRQLVLLGEFDIGQLVRNDFVRKFAVAVEAAAIEGASNGPTGIISGSGVSDLSVAGSGSLVTGEILAAMETQLANNNADVGDLHYLTTPGVRGYSRVTPISGSGGIAQPLWSLDNQVLGYNSFVSSLVPNDSPRDGGTDAHTIIFGNFADLMIAEFGAVEFIFDEITSAGSALINLTALGYFDVGLRHPASFVIRNDIRTSL